MCSISRLALKSASCFTFISLLSIGCATSPTGRKQVRLVDDKQMSELGRQSFAEMKRKIPPSSDREMIRLSNCVVNALLMANGHRASEWEISVFKNNSVNAFALPGKKIGVFEGIFKAAKTPAQLSAVLGHEIGHVLAHHGNERVSQHMLIDLGMTAGEIIFKKNPHKDKILMGALGLSMLGITLPYSRQHEIEADVMGVRLMAQAGFDPNEAVALWRNMSQIGGGGPEFLSTHPNPKTRIKRIEQEIPKVSAAYSAASRNQCE